MIKKNLVMTVSQLRPLAVEGSSVTCKEGIAANQLDEARLECLAGTHLAPKSPSGVNGVKRPSLTCQSLEVEASVP